MGTIGLCFLGTLSQVAVTPDFHKARGNRELRIRFGAGVVRQAGGRDEPASRLHRRSPHLVHPDGAHPPVDPEPAHQDEHRIGQPAGDEPGNRPV
jgi:hypothetical protein